MKRIDMNKEILNVINAVLDYKRFITSDNYIKHIDNFDWYSKTQEYYNSLPLPENMGANNIDFERILYYKSSLAGNVLEEMNNTEESELNIYHWK